MYPASCLGPHEYPMCTSSSSARGHVLLMMVPLSCSGNVSSHTVTTPPLSRRVATLRLLSSSAAAPNRTFLVVLPLPPFLHRFFIKDFWHNPFITATVIKSLGLDVKKIEECMRDSNDDFDNPVRKEEQDAQIGKGFRGDVTILPTLIFNNRQYQGKLEKGVVLKAICAGFKETTEPTVCLSGDIEINECLNVNGGCWQDKSLNITACKDTFRERVCACPFVQGVQFSGDGYSSCEASGPGRCKINNGGFGAVVVMPVVLLRIFYHIRVPNRLGVRSGLVFLLIGYMISSNYCRVCYLRQLI